MSATRTTTEFVTTRVQQVAKPTGISRENGPHLRDLREFVDACDGLPENVLVRFEKGHMSESGRHDVTISLVHQHPSAEATS
jgi:hypothetical protein